MILNYLGQQIFIIHPDRDIREGLVRSLQLNEFETFGISEPDIHTISKRRDSVVFLYISDDKDWNWRNFMNRIRGFEKFQKIVAMGSVDLPDGFDTVIEYSEDGVLDSILSYLSENNARGHRHYVRFGSQIASIATFEYHKDGNRYAGVIHDISVAGMSCTFKPEPENIDHMTVDEIIVSIPDYRASLSGRFTSKRVVGGQIIHVFRITGDVSGQIRDHIYDFIYSSLETKLSLR